MQIRVTSDSLSSAGARSRGMGVQSRAGKTLPREMHSEHNPPSAVCMGWVIASYLPLISLFPWCLFAGVCVCVVCAFVHA